MEIVEEDDSIIIKPIERMDIAASVQLYESLVDLINKTDRIKIDIINTQIVSTPFIQLLISLDKTLVQRGAKLKVINDHKSALHDAMVILGLKEKYDNWSNNNG